MRTDQLLALLVLAANVILGVGVFLSPEGLDRLRALKLERARMERESERLSLEIEQLRARVESVKGDPTEVERVARERLGLIRPNEVVVEFPR